MSIGLYVFLGVFLSIYSGMNYYIGTRIKNIIIASQISLSAHLYWIVFWVIALSYIAARMGERILPNYITDYLTKIGIYWMGAMFYLFMIFFAVDMLSILNKWLGIVSIGVDIREAIIFKGGLLVLSIVVGLLVYGHWNASNTKIVSYNIDINKSSSNMEELHAVLVSDIHLGDVIDGTNLSKMVDAINNLKPDVIFLAGDIIDSRLKPYQDSEMPDILKGLSAKHGVFAVLGNHEYYNEDPDDISKHYEEVGIKVLRDSYYKVDDSFYIVGRNDEAIKQSKGKHREKLEEILKDVDKSFPVILMDHNPKYINEAENANVDLQLSGHTHKGQMFPGSIITNLIFEIDWGHLRKGDFNIIVSSGYGTWGPPFRIGSSSEIVEIKIKFKQ